jgi:UDP-N-acetylglucosamine diphosphorylase / glucose-1-phosphate thymidylyltransferase / UDP-N-acetylgalactosamine diphosphorylase / glucosamine-1-phosphate N-acetyltransferase / galactosamine-1-phosphate N-acetyltransferase
MKAVVMVAGKSTRTYPLTLTKPKPLLKLLNKTILEHQLDALETIVETVILVVGYMKEKIQDALGDRWKRLAIEYVHQEEQLGTGHAVLQCANHIDAPFLVLNGDDLFDADDLKCLAAMEQGALVKHVEDPRLYGVYEVVDGNRVRRLVEKPKEIFSTLANVGAYKFRPNVFDVLRRTKPSERGEIEITCAVQALAETSDFRVVEMKGYWLPIGYPWHLLEANEYLIRNRFAGQIHGEVSAAAHLSGAVYVGEGSVIRPGTVIDGPVYIGDDCQIGPNCWLRPGATMCNGCRVGQGVEIKNSILFDGATVPHLSYVGDSIIGEHSNFGCGTITANLRHDGKPVMSEVQGELVNTGRRKLGAIVGDHVHTGIHTSIYPGRKLWPYTSTFPGESVSRDIMEALEARTKS